jgi:hypothetical protein
LSDPDHPKKETPYCRAYRRAREQYHQYAENWWTAVQSVRHHCRAKREEYGGWEQEKKVLEVSAIVLILIYTTIQGCQLSTVRDQEVRQLRAYVGTRIKELDCPSCEGLEENAPAPSGTLNSPTKDVVRFTTKNFGLTPAYNVRGCTNWKSFGTGDVLPRDIKDCVNKDSAGFSGVIQPGEELPDISPAHVRDIIRARKDLGVLYIVGCMAYDDAFGYGQTSPFCYVYEPQGPGAGGIEGFAECPRLTARPQKCEIK